MGIIDDMKLEITSLKQEVQELKGCLLASQMLENIAQERAFQLSEEVKELKEEVSSLRDDVQDGAWERIGHLG